jgi:hypothetical protein
MFQDNIVFSTSKVGILPLYAVKSFTGSTTFLENGTLSYANAETPPLTD